MRWLFLSLIALAGTACGGRVDSALVPEGSVGAVVCEDRVAYTEDLDPPYARPLFAHQTTTASFTYDTAARLTHYRETNSLGVALATIDYTHDTGGRPLRRDFVGAYAPFRGTFRWTYDDGTRAVRTDDDELIGDHVVRTTAGERYDDAGRIVFAWAEVDHRGDVTFAWPDANTVLGSTTVDGLVERVDLIGGRFVARDTHSYRGRVDSVESTTYDADLHPITREYSSASGNGSTTLEWEGGRVRVLRFHATGWPDRRIELDYDAAGHLVEKRTIGPDAATGYKGDSRVTFTWDGDRVVRVERRRIVDRAVLQSWDITYGCHAPRDLDGWGPVNDWKRELVEVPFQYDFVAMWAPPQP